ncbi:hypothetical protein [Actinoplanes sp. NPDC049265]|uniref:hypothetical protein n=1 Tax=Actinoplanes sp. NPDC049265 TaxID=3363902 RepID=UPI00371D5E8F
MTSIGDERTTRCQRPSPQAPDRPVWPCGRLQGDRQMHVHGQTSAPTPGPGRGGPAPQPAQMLLRLQREAGNRAVAALVPRDGPSTGIHGLRPVVVQRVLEPVYTTAPEGYAPIGELVREYNKLRSAIWVLFPTAKSRASALAKLGELERALYQWFDSHALPTMATTPDGQAMGNLLNQVRAERVFLVTQAVDAKGDPPLANFGHLDPAEQEQVRKIWHDLLANRGIQIGGEKPFRRQLLADFARLLETATGRIVVGALTGDAPTLTITPTRQDTGKFAASPEDPDQEGIQAVEAPAPAEADRYFPFDFTGESSPVDRKTMLTYVRVNHPGALGFSVKAGGSTRYFRFNRGTKSTMTVPADASDASLHPSSRLLGRGGNEIIAPVFVNLGHELGHVLRSLHGLGGSSADADALVEHAVPEAKDPDTRTEEIFNIDAVENRIRAEAGMSERGGHSNLVVREALLLHDRLGQALADAEQAIKEANRAITERGADPLLISLRDQASAAAEEHAEMLTAVQGFMKSGGDPADLDQRADALARRAATLAESVHERRLAVSAEVRTPPAADEVQRLSDEVPASVQRFGMEDRDWKKAGTVRNLSKGAYLIATASGESLVVKAVGDGTLAYRMESEGAVQEAMAAKLGEINGVGRTARTTMVQTAGAEGKSLLSLLGKLPPDGEQLAGLLRGAEVFLVMEYVPGKQLDEAAGVVAGSDRIERTMLFSGLGRQWAFDMLINNTDSFHNGNMGNVLLGPGGRVVGVDRMIGLNASNLGKTLGSREWAAQTLVNILNPERSRRLAEEIFDSLSKRPGSGFHGFGELFVRHFTRGALECVQTVAGLPADALARKAAEMPDFAWEAVADAGLGGAEVIQDAFAGARAEIASRLSDVLKGIAGSEPDTARIDAGLRGLDRDRRGLLASAADEIGHLEVAWEKADGGWLGHGAKARAAAVERWWPRWEVIHRTAVILLNGAETAADPAAEALVRAWRDDFTRMEDIVKALTDRPDHRLGKALTTQLRAAVRQALDRPEM